MKKIFKNIALALFICLVFIVGAMATNDVVVDLLELDGSSGAYLPTETTPDLGSSTRSFGNIYGTMIGAAPDDATYITQTPNGTLTGEQSMSLLSTGLVKNTTTTGIQSIAVDGTDYISSLLIDTTPQLGGSLDSQGEIIYGDNASGGDLLLQSTSNATKGDIQIGAGDDQFYWSETSGSLAIGYNQHTNVVNGTTYTGKLGVWTDNGETTTASIGAERNENTIAGFGGTIYLGRSRGNHATRTIVQSGDTMSRVLTVGFDGTDYALTSSIDVVVDGTPGNNDMPAYMSFKTSADGGQSPIEALRLDSSQDATFAEDVQVDGKLTVTGGIEAGSVEIGTTAVGGIDIPDGETIEFDVSPATDKTGTGFLSSVTVDVNATGIGACLHLDTDGHYIEADADAIATAPCSAIAMETGTGTKDVLTQGYFRNDSWAWTVGGILYLSTTAGGITQTAPSGASDVIQIVGIALTADIIRFEPNFLMSVIAS